MQSDEMYSYIDDFTSGDVAGGLIHGAQVVNHAVLRQLGCAVKPTSAGSTASPGSSAIARPTLLAARQDTDNDEEMEKRVTANGSANYLHLYQARHFAASRFASTSNGHATAAAAVMRCGVDRQVSDSATVVTMKQRWSCGMTSGGRVTESTADLQSFGASFRKSRQTDDRLVFIDLTSDAPGEAPRLVHAATCDELPVVRLDGATFTTTGTDVYSVLSAPDHGPLYYVTQDRDKIRDVFNGKLNVPVLPDVALPKALPMKNSVESQIEENSHDSKRRPTYMSLGQKLVSLTKSKTSPDKNHQRKTEAINFETSTCRPLSMNVRNSATNKVLVTGRHKLSRIVHEYDKVRPVSTPRSDRSVACRSISLYDYQVKQKKHSGDPIADSCFVVARNNSTLAGVADGVNWGEKAARAARIAVAAAVQHVNDALFGTQPAARFGDTRAVCRLMNDAMWQAHRQILKEHYELVKNGTDGCDEPDLPGLTTLSLCVVLPLPNDDERFVVLVANVGDSLVYLHSRRWGIREVTVGSHDVAVNRDVRDARGALGPARYNSQTLAAQSIYAKFDPALDNLTFSMTECRRGDFVILTTDGISDNFDPIVAGSAEIDVSQTEVKGGKPSVTAHERHVLAQKQMELAIHEVELTTGEAINAESCASALVDHCRLVTTKKRSVVESLTAAKLRQLRLRRKLAKQNDGEVARRHAGDEESGMEETQEEIDNLSEATKNASGKLDHASVAVFEVGAHFEQVPRLKPRVIGSLMGLSDDEGAAHDDVNGDDDDGALRIDFSEFCVEGELSPGGQNKSPSAPTHVKGKSAPLAKLSETLL